MKPGKLALLRFLHVDLEVGKLRPVRYYNHIELGLPVRYLRFGSSARRWVKRLVRKFDMLLSLEG